MSAESRKVLEMLAENKITAEEAEKLSQPAPEAEHPPINIEKGNGKKVTIFCE